MKFNLTMTKWTKITLIGLGGMNVIHAALHLIQFVQSVLLVSGGLDIEHILHNPIITGFWGLVGIVSLIIGIKDFRHHKNCH